MPRRRGRNGSVGTKKQYPDVTQPDMSLMQIEEQLQSLQPPYRAAVLERISVQVRNGFLVIIGGAFILWIFLGWTSAPHANFDPSPLKIVYFFVPLAVIAEAIVLYEHHRSGRHHLPR